MGLPRRHRRDPARRRDRLLPLPEEGTGRAATRRLPRRGHEVSLLLAGSVHWGGFKWTGSFTTVDLIAASTNALNGALLARRPDHYKQFTIVGIILMALLSGLGGGITRDIMVGQVPAALTNPAYILLCLVFGFVGYHLAYAAGQLFREGLFQFMTAFSLPWYAIV